MFNFFKAPLIRKQWIHMIHREGGKDFIIAERTKVCLQHLRSEVLRKFVNRQIYIKVVFLHNLTGQDLLRKKKKAKPEQQPLPAKKKLLTKDGSRHSDQSASVNKEVHETVKITDCEPSTSFKDETCRTPDLDRQITEQSTKMGVLKEKLKEAESVINNIRCKNIELKRKLAACEPQQ